MIVFGHNSFLLHGCKPSELGMPVDIDQKYRIERRQRYFHLFWIPTFGIGKVWVLRDLKSDQLYEPNAMVLQVLESLPLKEKTPWYTFALPLLALVVAIIAPIYMKAEEYASHKRYEAYTLEKNEGLKKAIQSPGNHRYFEVRNANYDKSFLKVVGSNEKTLKCLIVTGSYSNPDFLEAFARNRGVLDTVEVEKAKLFQSLNEDNLNNGVAALPDGQPSLVLETYVYDMAIIKSINVAYEEGYFLANLKNVGADVTLEKVEGETGNLKVTSQQTTLNAGTEFQLAGTYDGMEPDYSAVWTLKNAVGKTTAYEVRIHSSHVYINQQ